jgi:hypothetical protein
MDLLDSAVKKPEPDELLPKLERCVQIGYIKTAQFFLSNGTLELRDHFPCPTDVDKQTVQCLNIIVCPVTSKKDQRQQNTIIFHMVDVIKVTLVKYLSDPMCMVPMCSGPPSGLMSLQQWNCGSLSTATLIFVVACTQRIHIVLL